MTKDKMVKTLSEYFKKEGGPMDLRTINQKEQTFLLKIIYLEEHLVLGAEY